MKQPIIERFMSKVMPVPFSGCWLWDGFDLRDGYGGFSIDGHPVLAHRLSWRLHNGEIPDGLCVLHTCDIACCVNPNHLFLGTQQQNVADKVAKRRQARGDRHGMAKLTNAQTEEIRALKGTTKAKAIAPLYGVTPERIWQIWGPQ